MFSTMTNMHSFPKSLPVLAVCGWKHALDIAAIRVYLPCFVVNKSMGQEDEACWSGTEKSKGREQGLLVGLAQSQSPN